MTTGRGEATKIDAQLSHCRIVLRLFDDAAMFVYTKQYGLGAEVTGVRGAPGKGCRPWEVGILWTGLYKGNNMGSLLFFSWQTLVQLSLECPVALLL